MVKRQILFFYFLFVVTLFFTYQEKTALATDVPTINYRTHVQSYGWQSYVSNGSVSGTVGKSKRLEAIEIYVTNIPSGMTGGITYRTHVQSYGWQSWVYDGSLSGTSGQSKRLEAIQIKLTGTISNNYDVIYRVDRNGLMKMAQKFIKRNKTKKRKVEDTYPRSSDDIYYEQLYLSQPSSYSQQGGNSYYSQQQYHQRPYGYRADLHKMPMQEQQPKSSRFSFLNRSNSQNQSRPQQPRRQRIPNLSNKSNKPNKVNKPNRPNRSNLQSQAYPNQESSFDYRKIFANPVVLIILVVIIAYLIAYILGGIGGLKSGVIGLIEMFVALVLSYGLVLALEKDGAVVLVKGSIVFFISLISLIALILFL